MQRIAIIGCCPKGYRFAYGAGKSTLAQVLSSKLGLPVIHLDSYYWQPYWIETVVEKWVVTHQSLLKSDRWIIDGNYINTMDSRLAAADTIVWLDYSRFLCLWRIWQRFLKYRETVRPDMADNCVERLNWNFLLYVWNFNRNQRQLILSKVKIYQRYKQLIICQNQQELNNFLSEIK